jgi:hypothetical protein
LQKEGRIQVMNSQKKGNNGSVPYKRDLKLDILTRKGESNGNMYLQSREKRAEYCRIKTKKGRNPGK